jgi:hypothetical protein
MASGSNKWLLQCLSHIQSPAVALLHFVAELGVFPSDVLYFTLADIKGHSPFVACLESWVRLACSSLLSSLLLMPWAS